MDKYLIDDIFENIEKLDKLIDAIYFNDLDCNDFIIDICNQLQDISTNIFIDLHEFLRD